MEDVFSSILELAANNDLAGFERSVERDPPAVDEVGLWYGRQKGSNQMVLQHRTPLAVAATYGSVDVLRFIVSISSADINRGCGPDGTTALHCAAAGGSEHALDVAKILVAAGADPGVADANGRRPADVILALPKLTGAKAALEELLGCSLANDHDDDLDLAPEKLSELLFHEKKEYPVDPSLPDIKNSIYSTDEFRMFSFKVRPCSRAYSHDWTECPFVHPGENARRRDPRKFHYSCVPCPDFRKGACRRGDMCEYAHGVFECWLHPAQYRTRLCKDGTGCNRRVCFFAHTNEELRPLYMSTGSAVPSPRASGCPANAMELAAAMGLMPGSPSALSGAMSPFTPPMSPSGPNGSMGGWPQPNVPALHLPGANLHSSRLRSSLSARDMPIDDFAMMADFEAQQFLNDLSVAHLGSPAGARMARAKTMTPSNLDEFFSAEISSSPRYNTEPGAAFSPSHKSAIMTQFQQQQQSLLSPINTGAFSPRSMDSQQLPGHPSLFQASFGVSSPGRMSPRGGEPLSPMNSRMSAFALREKQQQLTQRSLSSRELGRNSPFVGSPVDSMWCNGDAPSGQLDWGVNGEELGRLRRSSSFERCSGGEEPDFSWVQSLVKESPTDKLEVVTTTGAMTSAAPSASMSGGAGSVSNSNPQMNSHDRAAALGAWLEKMQLEKIVA